MLWRTTPLTRAIPVPMVLRGNGVLLMTRQGEGMMASNGHRGDAHGREDKTLSVLTIGNSFSDNALRKLPGLARAAGCKLAFARANLGGCSLEQHWSYVLAHEANPDDPVGRPYGGDRFSLKQLLTRRAWDVVTLQQASPLSHDVDTYEPYATHLIAYVTQHVPHAEIMIHQTWAYRVDDPRYTPANEGKEPHSHRVMYEQVRQAYHTMAATFDAAILPSGDAMVLADSDPAMGFRPDAAFDFANALYPALPDQAHSLHIGWQWEEQDDGTRTLALDGHHANGAGEYLLSCVWFEVLYGTTVLDNRFVPRGIDPTYARFLRQTAHRAVAALSRD